MESTNIIKNCAMIIDVFLIAICPQGLHSIRIGIVIALTTSIKTDIPDDFGCLNKLEFTLLV